MNVKLSTPTKGKEKLKSNFSPFRELSIAKGTHLPASAFLCNIRLLHGALFVCG